MVLSYYLSSPKPPFCPGLFNVRTQLLSVNLLLASASKSKGRSGGWKRSLPPPSCQLCVAMTLHHRGCMACCVWCGWYQSWLHREPPPSSQFLTPLPSPLHGLLLLQFHVQPVLYMKSLSTRIIRAFLLKYSQIHK